MLDELFQLYLRLPSSSIVTLNSTNLYVTNSSEAFGIAPFHRFSERSSQQHGVTDLGYRLDPRLVTLQMTFRAATPDLYWSYRDALCQVFRPSNQVYTFYAVIPNGVNPDITRSLDCYLHKGLSFDTAKRKGLNQDFEVVLFAPDPTWYDPTLRTDTIQINEGSATVHLQMTFAGTWRVYPQIVIVGPIQNPKIINYFTNETLELAYSVAEGDTVTIETAYGKKTVKNVAGTNLISKLTDASDLATFHIDPEDYTLHNRMDISGTVPAGKHAHVTFNYYDRFIGI